MPPSSGRKAPRRLEKSNQLRSSSTAVSSRLIVLGNLLRRSASLRYRRLLDLPTTEYGIVGALGREKPITIKQLADLLGIDAAQLSRALGNLVGRGLVSRMTNSVDNREVLVALTAEGRQAYACIAAGIKERNKRLTANLSIDEVASLNMLIEKLTESALQLLRIEQEGGEQSG